MKTQSLTCHSPSGPHQIDVLIWGNPHPHHPPLLCVHGLIRNAWDFAVLAEALQQDRQIIAPHIVGRGSSSWLNDTQHYAYPQYCADMLSLIQQLNLTTVDWVGTSMGGIIGMMLAAMPETPIRRLVLNDVGPFIPFAALQRIAAYVSTPPALPDRAALERYLRTTYSGFGVLTDIQWAFMAEKSARTLPDGRLTLAYDPAIAQNLAAIKDDVQFWDIYDQITVPTLLLRGALSDILTAETARSMTQRGPKAQLVTIPACGHVPSLMDEEQIKVIRGFLGA